MKSFTRTTMALLGLQAMKAYAVPSSNAMSPANNSLEVAGWGYATFYDDTNCGVNPSVAFGMGNDACLPNMPNKNPIYVQPGSSVTNSAPSLVFTPGTECDCQDDCTTIAANDGHDFCLDLTGHQIARSFRFIKQGCSKNNCAA